MHELAMTQRVLDIALEKAKEAGADRVTAINLVVGEMSGIVDDCMQLYFDMLSQDSPASGASLSFQHVPARMACRRCKHIFSLDNPPWKCPGCGQWDVDIQAGRELYVNSIEVE